MRIVAVAGGSRGDVQPVVALAVALRGAGHEVSVAAGSDTATLVGRHGVTFVDLGVDVDAEMRTPAGREWLTASGGNAFHEMKLLRRFYEQSGGRLAEALLGLSGTADVFLSGLLSLDAVASLARHDRAGHAVALFSPIYPTRSGRAGLSARSATASLGNLLVSHIAQRAFGRIVTHTGGRIVRRRLGMKETGTAGFTRTLATTPAALAVSPLLTPRPTDWPTTVRVTGPWLLPPEDFVPVAELTDFLASGPPPVYLGFGSMTVAHPERIAELAEQVSRLAPVRVVTPGVGPAGALSDDVYATGHVPHTWLFPRTSGVVHHGGSGTTHAALLAGVPQLIVPHIGDQPYWGRRTYEEGIAAPAIPIGKLDPKRLADGVLQLNRTAQLRERARELADLAAREQGVRDAVAHFGW